MECISLLYANIIFMSLFCEILFNKNNILVSPREGKKLSMKKIILDKKKLF